MIFMPESGVEGAHSVEERLRRDIADEPFDTNRSPVNITISLGIAEMVDEISDLTALINRPTPRSTTPTARVQPSITVIIL